jgi:hypothetical protein
MRKSQGSGLTDIVHDCLCTSLKRCQGSGSLRYNDVGPVSGHMIMGANVGNQPVQAPRKADSGEQRPRVLNPFFQAPILTGKSITEGARLPVERIPPLKHFDS